MKLVYLLSDLLQEGYSMSAKDSAYARVLA